MTPQAASPMTLEEARRIVADQDVAHPERAIEAVAVVLRFHGIADASLLPIAQRLENAAASLAGNGLDAKTGANDSAKLSGRRRSVVDKGVD